jgi:hypothetical protein
VPHMLSQMRMNDTGPDAMDPTLSARGAAQ